MRSKALLTLLALSTALLAGCSGGETTSTTAEVTGPATIQAGMGAINGLLIDDIYRPIPNALILLKGPGLTATTDERGQFVFLDVLPGSYIAVATAEGHEASPQNVDVVEGVYADLEISARRLFSDEGTTITTQYSVFIPCATTTPALTGTYGYCMNDTSGDTYRPGLQGLNFTANKDLTYLVVEIKVNGKDNYLMELRHDNGDPFGGEQYGEAWLNATDYGKAILQKDASYVPGFANWTNVPEKPLAAILFYMGTGGDVFTSTLTPVTCPNAEVGCGGYFGAGQKFAIKANIILTAFLGEPTVDIEEYHVMAASE